MRNTRHTLQPPTTPTGAAETNGAPNDRGVPRSVGRECRPWWRRLISLPALSLEDQGEADPGCRRHGRRHRDQHQRLSPGAAVNIQLKNSIASLGRSGPRGQLSSNCPAPAGTQHVQTPKRGVLRVEDPSPVGLGRTALDASRGDRTSRSALVKFFFAPRFSHRPRVAN